MKTYFYGAELIYILLHVDLKTLSQLEKLCAFKTLLLLVRQPSSWHRG